MSRPKAWSDGIKLNLIDGPFPTIEPGTYSDLPQDPMPFIPPPGGMGLSDVALSLHNIAIANEAETNADFVETHREAFEHLYQQGWQPWTAWNYLNILANTRNIEGVPTLSNAEVLDNARRADQDQGGYATDRIELDIPAGDDWADVVVDLIDQGYDPDYLELFVQAAEDDYDAEDMMRMFENANLRELTFSWTQVLDQIWLGGHDMEMMDGDAMTDGGDDETGDDDVFDDEAGDHGMDDESAADGPFIDGDDGPFIDGDDSLPDYESSASPPEMWRQLVALPGGGQTVVPITGEQRAAMIASGNWEDMHVGGDTYVVPVGSPPTFSSPTSSPASAPPRTLYGTSSESDETDLESNTTGQFMNSLFQATVDGVSARTDGTVLDSPEGPQHRPRTGNDGLVATGAPGGTPPSGSGGGQEFASPKSNKGLGIRLTGGPATPSQSSVKSSPRSSLSSLGTSSHHSSREESSSSEEGSGSEESSTSEDGDDDDDQHPGEVVDDNEPSDDDSTASDSSHHSSDGGDHDVNELNMIHERLVEAHQSRNNDFVATYKAVFSVLASKDNEWSPHMAWRFVNRLVSTLPNTTTMSDLIARVNEIDEHQLYHEYTYVEEDALIGEVTDDAEHDQLAESLRTIYRAGFDAEYIRGYVRELVQAGQHPQLIDEEFDGYDPVGWLWEWAPAMWEIWTDAGLTDDAPLPSPASPTPVQNRAGGFPSTLSSSPRQSTPSPNAGSALRRSPRKSSGGTPLYSPSYPPEIPSSFKYFNSHGPGSVSTNIRRPAVFGSQTPERVRTPSFASQLSPSTPTVSQLGRTPSWASQSPPNTPTVSQLGRGSQSPNYASTTPPRRPSSALASSSPTQRSPTEAFFAGRSIDRRASLPPLPQNSLLRTMRNPRGASAPDLSRPIPRRLSHAPLSPSIRNSPATSRRSSAGRSSVNVSSPTRTPPIRNSPAGSRRSSAGKSSVNVPTPAHSQRSFDFNDEYRTFPYWPSSQPPNTRKLSTGNYLSAAPSPTVSELSRMYDAPGRYAPVQKTPTVSSASSRRRRGVFQRREPILDPLRYTNRLTPPRRLPNTPTRSHMPPSPRRVGMRPPGVCGECGRAHVSPKRTVGGRIAKTSAVKKTARSSVVKQHAVAPAAKKEAAKKAVVKKNAVKKGAIKKGVVKKGIVKKGAVKKTISNKSTVTPRRSERTTRRPDFLGN